MPLVAIDHPAVRIDLRYATADNITGAPIYDRAIALLHPDALPALHEAADRAATLGLALRIFDAFRPQAAQWRLWQACPDPDFVADPRIGSTHSRGVAVDLTLEDADGAPLDMGTGFDAMTPQSGHVATGVAPQCLRNRYLLLGLMRASGWQHHPHEWWHYNLPDPDRWPLVDDAPHGWRLMDRRLSR